MFHRTVFILTACSFLILQAAGVGSDQSTAVTMLQALQAAMAGSPTLIKVSFVNEDLPKEVR
ncbi:MAG TPA: hypothetical protein VK901_17600 [Nitrospiraceae bacterium]|nr:hypothetical protein [Nitrospiraceae bacterium]